MLPAFECAQNKYVLNNCCSFLAASVFQFQFSQAEEESHLKNPSVLFIVKEKYSKCQKILGWHYQTEKNNNK